MAHPFPYSLRDDRSGQGRARPVCVRCTSAHPFPYSLRDDRSGQGARPPGVRPVHLRPALAAAQAATLEGTPRLTRKGLIRP